MGRWPVLECDPGEIVSSVNWLTRFVNLMQKKYRTPGGLRNKRVPRWSTFCRDYNFAQREEQPRQFAVSGAARFGSRSVALKAEPIAKA